MSSSADNPFTSAFRRLEDCRRHWHDTLDAYFDPEEFRRHLNVCIQDMRNVTFVLQKHKKQVEDFDLWYAPWQEKMKADIRMRWLVEARNKVVKQGNLELKSVAQYGLVAGYDENTIPKFEVDIPPFVNLDGVIDVFRKKGYPEEYFRVGLIRIKRRWVDIEFGEHELLGVMRHCWSVLCSMLMDGSNTDDRDDSLAVMDPPPCMDSEHFLTSWYKINGDELTPVVCAGRQMEIDRAHGQKAVEHYGREPVQFDAKSACDFARTVMKNAIMVMEKDGYHLTFFFMLKDGKPLKMGRIDFEERSDKFLMMHQLAQEALRIGANGFITVSEAWTARLTEDSQFMYAEDAPDRGETLVVQVADAEGNQLMLQAVVRREGEKTIVEPAVEMTGGAQGTLMPIIEAWKNAAGF